MRLIGKVSFINSQSQNTTAFMGPEFVEAPVARKELFKLVHQDKFESALVGTGFVKHKFIFGITTF